MADNTPAEKKDANFKVEDKSTADHKLKNQKVIWLEAKGDDGKTLSGEFVIRRLTIGQITQVGTEVARRNSHANIDNETNFLNNMISLCKYGILKSPAWFDPENMFDSELLGKVYTEVMAFQASFRSVVREQNEGAEAPL